MKDRPMTPGPPPTLAGATACPCGDSRLDLKADHRGTFVQCDACLRAGPRATSGRRPRPGSEREAVKLWNGVNPARTDSPEPA